MDAPYRIETYRNGRYEQVYAIQRSGVGLVCEVFSLTYARKIIDGLNKDARDAKASSPDRRVHQGGDAPLAGAADRL